MKKATVEPLLIFFAFTTGALINYQSPNQKDTVHGRLPISRDESPSPRSSCSCSNSDTEELDLKTDSPKKKPHFRIQHPKNHQFRHNLTSKLLARFPFLLEIMYWFLTYWPYQLMRAWSAQKINATRDSKLAIDTLALNNAISVLKIEEFLGLAWEKPWQDFFLKKIPWIMPFIRYVYLAHICVGVSFLVYGYTYFPRHAFQQVRRTIALDNWIAFTVFTLYRCAPPRLMPSSYGFIDVLHPKSTQHLTTDPSSQSFDWSNNNFQLKVAAMPSLHFGTSCLIGLSLLYLAPTKHFLLKRLGIFYPLVMFIVVVTTANHWVLDCIVGFGVVLLGFRLNRILLNLQVLEAWAFWLIRTEKPGDARCEGVLAI